MILFSTLWNLSLGNAAVSWLLFFFFLPRGRGRGGRGNGGIYERKWFHRYVSPWFLGCNLQPQCGWSINKYDFLICTVCLQVWTRMKLLRFPEVVEQILMETNLVIYMFWLRLHDWLQYCLILPLLCVVWLWLMLTSFKPWWIYLQVREDPVFRREGADIHVDTVLSITQVMLSCRRNNLVILKFLSQE